MDREQKRQPCGFCIAFHQSADQPEPPSQHHPRPALTPLTLTTPSQALLPSATPPHSCAHTHIHMAHYAKSTSPYPRGLCSFSLSLLLPSRLPLPLLPIHRPMCSFDRFLACLQELLALLPRPPSRRFRGLRKI